MMDFNYTFKQAHNDRLEDASVRTYRVQENKAFGYARRNNRAPVKQLRIAIAALISTIVK